MIENLQNNMASAQNPDEIERLRKRIEKHTAVPVHALALREGNWHALAAFDDGEKWVPVRELLGVAYYAFNGR